ncbi:hypothetical protein FD47_GL001216 [Lentilactobacillus parafarraginis DSM 18390 = JCM 14109]|uniref:Uncharacterized protein n=1 Tax=Lentilactobacillus parafarraginis DSM 18390 = JCM 14109 TaxID=1423786 RepID=A0A0R1YNQ6_9LACO|nr:hypothetical protein FD47_GL001216 [Lentilactobacillus parafarraginis DSM 18390 = JCM 14109]
MVTVTSTIHQSPPISRLMRDTKKHDFNIRDQDIRIMSLYLTADQLRDPPHIKSETTSN